VLDLRSETEEPEDDFTRGALLAALLPVRSELLRGDMRAAYIAWLLAVNANANDVDDATPEPPLPPGLLNLSAPLKALVEFLRIDPDLLSAAAERSGSEVEDTGALHAWVAALSPLAKDQWLKRAVNEPDLALGAELRRTFRAGGTKVAASPRTVAELRAAADELRAKRERARRVVGESGYYDYRAAGPLARLLELHIDLLEGTAASELERMAVHRVAMTVIIETMDRVDDSLADMSELFAASERRAAATHRRLTATHRGPTACPPAVLHP
jgi:hypothetical protein